MAASDKDIVISPQRGSTTNDPGIVFTGNGNDPISIFALDNTTGSLSFEGSAGQLFNITNNLTSGSIFSVNDVSGIPSIDVNADGTVSIVAYGGTVGIATTLPTSSYKLDVVGNVRIDGDLAVTSTTLVSNLNADTVDGIQASSFLRSDANDTTTGNITISKTSPKLILSDTNITTGSYPAIQFDTNNNQGVLLEHNELDGELPVSGYGLILKASPNNAQFPSTGTLTFTVLGEIYTGSATTSTTSRVLTTADEGSGNGLDADTVDGIEGSSFLRSDVDDETTGQIRITRANSTANGGGQIYLNGSTGNRIDWSTAGVSAPAFTTRSVGTKLVLYPAISASQGDYALGIESSTLWYSVPGTSQTHRWYGGTTSMMSLSGGNLDVLGTITGSRLISDVANGTAPLTVTSTTLVSNLNVDLLDDQQGSYYLDYNNFTNTPTIPTNNNELTNGAGYITSFDITTQTDPKYLRSDATDSASGALTFSGGLALTSGPGTIAAATFANGWLRIGDSSGGITMDPNELYFAGAGNIGALSGGSITFTTRPAFNGGTSGSSSPFTVDSTQVVTNLNADLLDGQQGSYYLDYNNFTNTPTGVDADTLDGVNSTSFLRSDVTDTYDGTTSGRYLRFQCVAGNTATSSSNLFPLEVYQSSTVGDAAMTFHIGNLYATYFGLDHSTNDLFTGGWSDGSTKHRIFHAGNIPQSGGWFTGTAPMVRSSDGVMEIGRYIDFHTSNTATADYNARLDCNANGTLALLGSFTTTGNIDITGNLAVNGICGTLKSKTSSFSTGSSASGFLLDSSGVHRIGNNTDSGNNVLRVFGSTGEFRVKGDGDCQNTGNTYTVISDINLKENIVDANSQWDDIKGVRIRNYNLKSSTGWSTHRQIGVIAQELETVCPGLVKDSNEEDDDGNVTGTIKTVLSSVLYMKAVKALQEAMERIETLEAKVAALESGT